MRGAQHVTSQISAEYPGAFSSFALFCSFLISRGILVICHQGYFGNFTNPTQNFSYFSEKVIDLSPTQNSSLINLKVNINLSFLIRRIKLGVLHSPLLIEIWSPNLISLFLYFHAFVALL